MTEFVQRWGEGSFVTLDRQFQDQVDLPIQDKIFLMEVGLPRETGWFDIIFDFPPDYIPTLSETYKGKRRLPEEYSRYLVLGGNDACYICVDPDRQYSVISVEHIAFEDPPGFINSSIVQMAESFLALHEAIFLLTDESKVEEVTKRLQDKIAKIDPDALSGDHWWPQVLEEFDFY